ncbi:MAG: RluA family pseudouridine synthase [Treponema sp.]|uniref:RluA family pseudouridine synthase n=1 Tax=Treponema sp. TaxID=166 RepID=UPI003FA31498
MKFTFHVKSKTRLDIFLRSELTRAVSASYKKSSAIVMSNSKIRRMIVADTVSVDGVHIRRPAYVLLRGQVVYVEFDKEKFFFEKQTDDIAFELTAADVLYEDNDLIAVNKPAFFPTEETIVGSEKRDCLHAAIVRYLWAKMPTLRNPPYVGIIHRLDRETSGAILFTKNRAANAAIHKMFEKHTVQKIYCAVCAISNRASYARELHGFETNSEFFIENHIGRISPKSARAKWGELSAVSGGLYAHTDFKVLERGIIAGIPVVKIEARPLTGRTHQIRVHLASIGLPILGDVLYGAPEYKRTMLHAERLTFLHPISGNTMTVSASPSDEFLQ